MQPASKEGARPTQRGGAKLEGARQYETEDEPKGSQSIPVHRAGGGPDARQRAGGKDERDRRDCRYDGSVDCDVRDEHVGRGIEYDERIEFHGDNRGNHRNGQRNGCDDRCDDDRQLRHRHDRAVDDSRRTGYSAYPGIGYL